MATTATAQQNNQYIAQGGANDDKGSSTNNVTTGGGTPTTTSDSGDNGVQTINVTATQIQRGNKKPTIRENPLSYFSSYTYQLSLYMLTPDAYTAFIESGRTNINNLVATTTSGSNSVSGGAYLLMQSGGINRDVTPRAPGFDLDYYIEDLQIQSVVGTNLTRSSAVTVVLDFKIVEPYGFSFLTKLKKARDAIVAYSKSPQVNQQANPSREIFVLGIRFQGYDDEGNLMSGKEMINGQVLDPTGQSNGLFESFYDIMFKKISFRIDGRTTVYNINCVSTSTNALSVKYGLVQKNTTLSGTTVYDLLMGNDGLLASLNNYQKTLLETKKIKIPHKYNIEYIGDIEDSFKQANIASPGDFSKYRWAMSRARNTSEVNEQVAVTSTPNSKERFITFGNSTSILTAVEKIVLQSSFLGNALKVLYKSELENDPKTKTEDEDTMGKNGVIRWYNIAAQAKILGFDTDTSEYAYDVTFVISPYETPIAISPYVKKLPAYYGPVKRYEYWFTGKNTEVINYEQTNNNGYYISIVGSNVKDGKSQGGGATIPALTNSTQTFDKNGQLYTDREAQSSFLATDLYDPSSYSNAKITIMGDPDFLIKDAFNNRVGEVYDQFYGPDGRTINANGGQVLIEVNFKEAVDYDDQDGLMSINDAITFWQYPEYIKKIVQGVSYRVTKATSHFKGGKFYQELDCIINTFGPSDKQWASDSASDDSYERAENAKFARQGNAKTTGLVPAPDNKPTTPPTATATSQTPSTEGTSSQTYTQYEGGRE